MRYLILIVLLFFATTSYTKTTIEQANMQFEDWGWTTMGNWKYIENKDEFSDEKSITLISITVDEGEAGLKINCKDKDIDQMSITSSDFLDANSSYNVKTNIRFDNKDAYVRYWDRAKNHKTVIIRDRSVKKFLKNMLSSQELLVGLPNYEGLIRKYRFPVSGLKPVLDRFKDHCGKI